MLSAMVRAISQAGHKTTETGIYAGDSDILVLFGVGAPSHAVARQAHVSSGRRAVLFDLGYFSRKKVTGYVRMSIDFDHPQYWLGCTKPDPSRFDVHGIELRADSNPAGPIVLVGLGKKARSYLGERDWEVKEYRRLKQANPGRRIVLRPKPGHPKPNLPCEFDDRPSIEEVLKGASLVVAKHSNVCVDAVIAGVPYQATDGAAIWLQGKPFTAENRLDFLHRLAWWQWMPTEAAEAWQFARNIIGTECA